MIERIELAEGKYTVLYDSDTGAIETLRYGEPWRDHVGDHLVGALVERILELENKERSPSDDEEYKFCERCSVELLRVVEGLCSRCAAMKTAKEIIDGKEITLFSSSQLKALREALERRPLWVRNTPDEQRAVLYDKMDMIEEWVRE